MKIRSIVESEINKYLSLGSTEKNNFNQQLLTWFDEGRARPEWSFVAEENGKFIGRVIYGIFKDEPTELKVWNIHLSTETEHNAPSHILVKLLSESIDEMKGKGFNTIEYHLYSGKDGMFEEYKKVFATLGFEVTQQKKSFVWKGSNLGQTPRRLQFKSLGEIGEKEFVNAIQVVSEGTLDQDDLDCIEEFGPLEAATQYYNILKDIDFNETWWKVAYTNDGGFVGLIVPQKLNENFGAINYIGVSPEKRGNGYVDDLLYEGTKTLLDYNIKKIIADIDTNNYPLEAALNKQDYKESRSMEVLKLSL